MPHQLLGIHFEGWLLISDSILRCAPICSRVFYFPKLTAGSIHVSTLFVSVRFLLPGFIAIGACVQDCPWFSSITTVVDTHVFLTTPKNPCTASAYSLVGKPLAPHSGPTCPWYFIMRNVTLDNRSIHFSTTFSLPWSNKGNVSWG